MHRRMVSSLSLLVHVYGSPNLQLVDMFLVLQNQLKFAPCNRRCNTNLLRRAV